MSSKSNRRELTRRQVLKGAAGAAALTVLPSRSRAQPNLDFDCIVLGAGMAGVVAGRDLHLQGRKVLILEGADRIGGRMFTLRNFIKHPDYVADSESYPLEAGAEYVHVKNSERYTVFYRELGERGFSTVSYPKFLNNRLGFPLSWKREKDLPSAMLCDTDLWPTISLLSDIKGYEGRQTNDISAAEYLRNKSGLQRNGSYLARYTLSAHTPGRLFDPLVDICRVAPAGASSADPISVAGISVDRLPDQLVDELHELKLVQVTGGIQKLPGYDALPHAIADQITAPSRVLTGQRVVKVERLGDGVVVTVQRSDGSSERFSAKTAVSTFSVGMLDPVAGSGPQIFGDLLVDDKIQALESIKMGPITKLSLEFKQRHWKNNPPMTVLSNPTGCARTLFSAFPGADKGPFVATALMMNQDHAIVHEMADDAAVEFLLREIQRVLAPDDAPWRPEDVLVGSGSGTSFVPNYSRQDWAKDAFAKGGNSYISYQDGVGTEAVGRLRERLKDPRSTLPVFWAGEATATAYDNQYQPLSVHGAFISGRGAAEDVEAYLQMADQERSSRQTAFNNYYTDKYPAVASTTASLMLERGQPASRSVEIALTPKQRSQLKAYAASAAGGDQQTALRQLIEVGLYLHRSQPEKLKGMPKKKATQKLTVTVTASDLERIEAHAASETGGNTDLAVLGLVIRALEELPKSAGTATDECG